MRIWAMRSKPAGRNELSSFLQKGVLAIGHLPNERLDGKSITELKELLLSGTQAKKETTACIHAHTIQRFISSISCGDFVFAPAGKYAYICRVVGQYEYCQQEAQAGWPHQRKVFWLTSKGGSLAFDRSLLPAQLDGALGSRHLLYSLERHAHIIQLIQPWMEENVILEPPAPIQEELPNSDEPEPMPRNALMTSLVDESLIADVIQSLRKNLQSQHEQVKLDSAKILMEVLSLRWQS